MSMVTNPRFSSLDYRWQTTIKGRALRIEGNGAFTLRQPEVLSSGADPGKQVEHTAKHHKRH
jgi:hypothetical protein